MSRQPSDPITEHAALIGGVTIAWNDLNYILSYLFRIFTGMPEDKATAVYFTPKSDSTQRALLKAVAKIALKSHPKLWLAFKKSLDRINDLAGERNAATHTSWAVQFPDPKVIPASFMPLHGKLRPDFVEQFKALPNKLAEEFLALNEVRVAFERLTASGRSRGDTKRRQIAAAHKANRSPAKSLE